MNLIWNKLEPILAEFYSAKGLAESLKHDVSYLSRAYAEIESLWLEEYHSIERVKYIMLSEAPLWGSKKKYIYNPKTNNSQFFYRSDIEYATSAHLTDKPAFIRHLNEIGFLVLDISPYALNPSDTKVNYRSMTISEYRLLLTKSLPIHLGYKLALIDKKRAETVRIFYRYSRVKNAFNDLLSEQLIRTGFISGPEEILSISQSGGGINKALLKAIVAPPNYV